MLSSKWKNKQVIIYTTEGISSTELQLDSVSASNLIGLKISNESANPNFICECICKQKSECIKSDILLLKVFFKQKFDQTKLYSHSLILFSPKESVTIPDIL